jgi:hypothetical protein
MVSEKLSGKSLQRLTRLSRALNGRDKRLYEDFMQSIRLLEELDDYEHDSALDKKLKAFLFRVKDFWPVREMR